MKRLFAITTIVVLCSSLLFVVASPAAEAIPFDGKWWGKSYVFYNPACPPETPLEFISIGRGVSSLMGGVDWFGMVCLNLETGLGAGTAIVSKPNGDALYLSIDSLILNPDETWTQRERIVGGAGRFSGYTGESSSSGAAELNPLTFTGFWSGTNEGVIYPPE